MELACGLSDVGAVTSAVLLACPTWLQGDCCDSRGGIHIKSGKRGRGSPRILHFIRDGKAFPIAPTEVFFPLIVGSVP